MEFVMYYIILILSSIPPAACLTAGLVVSFRKKKPAPQKVRVLLLLSLYSTASIFCGFFQSLSEGVGFYGWHLWIKGILLGAVFLVMAREASVERKNWIFAALFAFCIFALFASGSGAGSIVFKNFGIINVFGLLADYVPLVTGLLFIFIPGKRKAGPLTGGKRI